MYKQYKCIHNSESFQSEECSIHGFICQETPLCRVTHTNTSIHTHAHLHATYLTEQAVLSYCSSSTQLYQLSLLGLRSCYRDFPFSTSICLAISVCASLPPYRGRTGEVLPIVGARLYTLAHLGTFWSFKTSC